MEEALAGIGPVLGDEGGRPDDGLDVAGVAGIGAAEYANFAGGPGQFGEPFYGDYGVTLLVAYGPRAGASGRLR